MENIEDMISQLRTKDNNIAYEALKALQVISEQRSDVYSYMDYFAEMLEDTNSFVRNRGLVLLAINARWDKDNKIDEYIDYYLPHITDVKPITARQCIKMLPLIAKYKPELRDAIIDALKNANVSIYKESMMPLVYKDIKDALELMQREK